MAGFRRYIRVALVALAGLAAACGAGEAPAVGGDSGQALADGRSYARAVIARGWTASEVDDETAVAVGYLERLRLGLGSPFRLMDYALRDPRLDRRTRRRVAWALLARTLDGRAYRIHPAALDRAGGMGVGSRTGAGRQHLRLIEGAVREATDPRGGELSVRLAYALAAVEQSVDRWAFRLATQAAALIRDRELARADARELLRVAEETGADPLALIPLWRTERRFRVERPPMEAIPSAVEREAIDLAPRLAGAIRSLGPRLAGDGAPPPARRPARPLLGPAAAERLAELADALAPPQTPVVVAVDVHRRQLLDGRGVGAERAAARRRFLERATNEERFVAEYALLGHRDPAYVGVPARVALWTAVALRPYAQEEVWFPGFGGPSTRALKTRFGLASVRFDPDVPDTWRPYYRRMLAHALSDLVRVLPSLNLHGLHVRFGTARGRSSTLALHDPGDRVVYLPPATGAGTIVHEVAHDLDWQISMRRYRVRGDYGTDRATRRRHGWLAATVQRLTRAPLQPPAPGDSVEFVHSRRPAEVFARSLDWFVVVSLAREGRMNGYLSSVQDDVLTGYGTVRPPDITGAAGAALVNILDEVAPVHAETRTWFLEHYGPGRDLRAYDLVRTVAEGDVETPLVAEAGVERRFAALEAARNAALREIREWVCRTPAAAYDRRLEAARRRLVALAAGARARGIVLEYARERAGRAGRRWAARRFYGAPWPSASVDSLAAAALDPLIARARTAGQARVPPRGEGFRVVALAPERCTASASPLL